MNGDTIDEVRSILSSVLQLGSRGDSLDADSPLLGSLPELDSMAVVTVVTALEDHYGFMVEDDEIDADAFETLGALAGFVEHKLRG